MPACLLHVPDIVGAGEQGLVLTFPAGRASGRESSGKLQQALCLQVISDHRSAEQQVVILGKALKGGVGGNSA